MDSIRKPWLKTMVGGASLVLSGCAQMGGSSTAAGPAPHRCICTGHAAADTATYKSATTRTRRPKGRRSSSSLAK